jgi:RNA polymerase sigma factor (sigma-70 family)
MNQATRPSLSELLERLRQGDEAAAETVFRAYEPYLRVVVRRQLSAALRTKFDSADIVQSVWADLVCGFRQEGWSFPDTDRLRAFLVKATRNRFIDRLRRHLTEMEREQSLGSLEAGQFPHSPEPDPSEVMQADELWEQLLAGCSPLHREILHLKRQGRTLAEIARATGLHESSVRRILYQVANRLQDRGPWTVDRGS